LGDGPIKMKGKIIIIIKHFTLEKAHPMNRRIDYVP
jgi:hypothetical protein